METTAGFLEILTALFVIVDPFGNVPVFLALTRNQTPEERRRTAHVAAATVLVLLVGALLAGEPVLRLFGIRLASFRVAGGMLLLLMAASMVQARPSGARHTPEEDAEAEDRHAVGAVPLAIPLLAGPGAMTAVIVYGHAARSFGDTLVVAAAAAVVAASVAFVFRSAERLQELLGATGINIITRLMGLVTAGIAVEFLAAGLRTLLPGLAA